MRITDNLLARAVLNGSSRALSRIADAQARIASGKNLLRPSDDPLALAKVLGLKSELSRIDAHSETTIMVGDRMDTDIISGLEAGLRTVLVLTGSTRREQVETFPYRPSRIVDSVADLIRFVDHGRPVTH